MKKIKTGVVGYGFSAKIFQCPFIVAHKDFELAAVVERSTNESKKDYPMITVYKDYMDLLKDDEIELVILSTPNHLHFEQAKLALEFNKHVLVEKPYTATYEEALELNELAKEKGKISLPYQNRRFDGDFLTIKKLVDDGVRIFEYEAVWDRFVPEVKGGWHESGEPSNNLLYDLGPHYLDQALQLFGEPDEFYKIAHKLRANTKIIDHFTMMLTYKDKVVRLKSTMVAAKSDIRYKLHTDIGTFHFYKMGEQEHQLLAGMKPDDKNYGDNAIYHQYDYQGNKIEKVVVKGNYLMFFTELAQAIRNGGKPPVTPEEALNVIKLLSK
jgi:scyllo-inositol 2-dehydrogenase (NADP+)